MTDVQPDGVDGPEAVEDQVTVGWYPDPTRSRKPRERLWDGSEWTRWTRQLDEARQDDLAAGWFQEPDDPATERLWTGSQWTDHRRPAELEPEEGDSEEERTRPEAPSPLQPTIGVPGWYPSDGRPGIQRYWDGEDWTHDAREAPTAPCPAPVPPDLPAPASETAAVEEPGASQEVASPPDAPDAPDASPADAVSQLTELARLRDTGALTDEEFEAAKSKVLRRI